MNRSLDDVTLSGVALPRPGPKGPANSAMVEEEEEEEVGAWDDIHGGTLPKEMVEEARQEEIGFMAGRNIWSLKPNEDC